MFLFNLVIYSYINKAQRETGNINIMTDNIYAKMNYFFSSSVPYTVLLLYLHTSSAPT